MIPGEYIDRIVKIEGIYSDDAADPGGETYCGISRRHHPDWDGWEILDCLEDKTGYEATSALRDHVASHYNRHFWYPIHGDAIYAISRRLSWKVFDVAVSKGVRRASEYLQRALNLVNLGGRLYDDLAVDGIIGPVTVRAIELLYASSLLTEKDTDRMLINTLSVFQGMSYVSFLESGHGREKFRGLLLRIFH